MGFPKSIRNPHPDLCKRRRVLFCSVQPLFSFCSLVRSFTMTTSLPKTGTLCTFPNCGKPLRARGFCVACYYRLLRRKELAAGTQTKKWRHRLSNIDPVERTAVCAECGNVKINKRGPGLWRCIHPKLNENARKYKAAYRQNKKLMLKPSCEICGINTKLCWDHDHATGKFRGTLCVSCNLGLGSFRDDPQFLRAAADYLEKSHGGTAVEA